MRRYFFETNRAFKLSFAVFTVSLAVSVDTLKAVSLTHLTALNAPHSGIVLHRQCAQCIENHVHAVAIRSSLGHLCSTPRRIRIHRTSHAPVGRPAPLSMVGTPLPEISTYDASAGKLGIRRVSPFFSVTARISSVKDSFAEQSPTAYNIRLKIGYMFTC